MMMMYKLIFYTATRRRMLESMDCQP